MDPADQSESLSNGTGLEESVVMNGLICDAIAHIENDYTEKFGIPRQSGLVNEVVSRIVFEEPYRNPDALRGLDEFSHLWLIWVFSEARNTRSKFKGAHDGRLSAGEVVTAEKRDSDPGKPDVRGWSPTVRPPRLGGNERVGVFATRSPNRPTPIGLSCVEIVSVEPHTSDGPVITVLGADLMTGTPILDIKPYIVYADARPDADSGFADEAPVSVLSVEGIELLPDEVDKAAVAAILAQDPRPRYHDDPNRVYGMRYGECDIRFTVCDGVVVIAGVSFSE